MHSIGLSLTYALPIGLLLTYALNNWSVLNLFRPSGFWLSNVHGINAAIVNLK